MRLARATRTDLLIHNSIPFKRQLKLTSTVAYLVSKSVLSIPFAGIPFSQTFLFLYDLYVVILAIILMLFYPILSFES